MSRNNIQEKTTSKQTAQQNINLLIMVLSPRKIKEFYQKLNLINQKYDCIVIKNDFDELHAYNSGREYFLKRPEYTHLAILPDDLLVDVSHIDTLVNDLKQGNYPVLSGVCNFAYSTRNFFNRMAMIEYKRYEAIDTLKKTGKYNYEKDIIKREDWEKLRDDQVKNKNQPVIRVTFSAFSFTIVRRDVVELIKFGHNPMGVDVVFFQDCIKNSVPTYANLTTEMLHMKGMEDNREMRNIIDYIMTNNVNTKVNTNQLNPPKREEIFMPKKIK